MKDMDFAIDFSAQAVRVARLGAASADAGRIGARLSRAGDTLVVDNLAVQNLGGAALSGAASFGPAGGRGQARLDADKLTDLAALARRIWPSRWSDALAALAGASRAVV